MSKCQGALRSVRTASKAFSIASPERGPHTHKKNVSFRRLCSHVSQGLVEPSRVITRWPQTLVSLSFKDFSRQQQTGEGHANKARPTALSRPCKGQPDCARWLLRAAASYTNAGCAGRATPGCRCWNTKYREKKPAMQRHQQI